MCCENSYLAQAESIKAYVTEVTGQEFEKVPRDIVDRLSEIWVCLRAEDFRDCMKKNMEKNMEKKKAENRRKNGKEDCEKK